MFTKEIIRLSTTTTTTTTALSDNFVDIRSIYYSCICLYSIRYGLSFIRYIFFFRNSKSNRTFRRLVVVRNVSRELFRNYRFFFENHCRIANTLGGVLKNGKFSRAPGVREISYVEQRAPVRTNRTKPPRLL